MEKISIVVPVFNEEKILNEFFLRTNKIEENKLSQFEIEYIYIDDGSVDGSLSILKDLCKKKKNVKIISFTRNFGHQNALGAGLLHADGDYIAVIDADLQDPPELIPEMLDKIKSGFDVVYGKRKIRKGESFFKLFSAKIFYRTLNYLCDIQIPKDTGDFRIITKKVKLKIDNFKEKNRFIRGLIPWLGFKSFPFEYIREERYAGETKYTLKKMMIFALDAIISFSSKPIFLLMKLGLYTIFFSTIYSIYILYKKFVLDEIIPGFTPVFLGIIFFGGLNLFFIGLVGIYVAKIFEQTKDRPNYIINEKINF